MRFWNWLTRRGCQHADRRGVATYYEREFRVYLRLSECRDCGIVLIEEV